METMVCSWCSAPAHDPDAKKCPRCGAVYAKAAALAAGLPARAAGSSALGEPTPTNPTAGTDGASFAPPPIAAQTVSALELLDAAKHKLEQRLRIGSLPGALLFALLIHASASGRFFQRLLFTRLLHELGHAVTAWLCGFSAVPLLWSTRIGERRALVMTLNVGLGIAWLLSRAVRARHVGLIALGAVLALAQLVGTLALSPRSAAALITFGGDAGAMILGTALMATFFFGEDTQLKQHGLRWGFLVIGAAAYVDTFGTWWAARHDWDAIPFGEIERVGLSDPSKLTDDHAWSVELLVQRYVMLGVACALLISGVWIWGIISHARATR